MTATLTRDEPHDYDDSGSDRWLDDEHGGDRWRRYGECRYEDVNLFFPEGANGEEPPYPTPDVKEICDRCPVRSYCLTTHMDEEYGIYGGLTGYQRGLLSKKIRRKSCPGCTSTDVITEKNHEICLACGVSWEAI